MYAHNVLRDDMLVCLERQLEAGVGRMEQDPSQWGTVEAVLHAYASVAETVAESDAEHIPRFIRNIPQIPFRNNTQLISVALTTLGM